MTTPGTLFYTNEHIWLAAQAGDEVRAGVTAYAVGQLGEIVALDLPKVGAQLRVSQSFGTIESSKTVSDLYAPADAVVVAVNAQAQKDPALVGEDPYGAGWLVKLRIEKTTTLLDASAYDQLCAEEG